MSIGKMISKVVALSAFLTLASAVTIYAQANGTIIGDNVNVRASGSTESAIVATVGNGQAVVIKAKEGDFYKVSYNGTDDLYISSQFVDIKQAQGSINDASVNIRKGPSTDSEVLTKANAGDNLEVIGAQGDWYVINYNGEKAFVNKDFISGDMLGVVPTVEAPVVPVANTEETFAVVVSDTGLNLRQDSSANAKIVSVLSNGDVLDVVDVEQEWVKVGANGEYGYVSSDFISVQTGIKPETSNSRDARASEIVNYAKQFLGTPYRSGGSDLNSGVDCSGYVYAIMKNKGVSVNRSSREQARNGRVISKNELLPADLVFFDSNGANDGNISHVGIYIGDGKYIHSSTTKVVISEMNSAYSLRTYVTACRIIE